MLPDELLEPAAEMLFTAVVAHYAGCDGAWTFRLSG